MDRPVSVQVSHADVRWRLKQAAAERHQPVRALVTEVLSRWLAENGYELRAPLDTNAPGVAGRDS